ncbi:MAG: amidoligase family protein [Clostridium sp.]|nr:amidoligase family protein [Clostridium sp.]
MLTGRFGIEIELTGITKDKAAETIKTIVGGRIEHTYDSYATRKIHADDGRDWKVMNDASIRKVNSRGNGTNDNDYSVEVVSPILTEADIDTIQLIARALRAAGGRTNDSCGIHIHLDGSNQTVQSIKNYINIIASKNDLLYKALQIKPARTRWCKKMDERLINEIRKKKPKTMQKIKDIWYNKKNAGYYSHYDNTRYHFLNLHSFFNGNGTVELRGFNSTLHAGKIKAYILLALAINQQALTQKKATCKKVQEENEKFAMRVYLNRIGFVGEEYKNYREHLYRHLDGCAAWRYGYSDPRYKKNKKEAKIS